MPPKTSQSQRIFSQSKTAKKLSTRQLDSAGSIDTSSRRRIDPLTAFANITPPKSSPQPKSAKAKGKEKAKDVDPLEQGAQLWVDKYEPMSEGELAVHKRKVDDVRNWLEEAFVGGPSGKLRKYRRILALTGPAGTAKTTTVRILSTEMGFEIMEWRNSMADSHTGSNSFGSSDTDYQSHLSKFQDFLTRASSCHNVFSNAHKRRIILLEELPNILHRDTQENFQAIIKGFVDASHALGVPMVVIVSDAGVRGDTEDGRGWNEKRDNVVDIRTVLPKDVLHSPYVREIRFNPIATTLMRKALQALLAKTKTKCTSAAMLDIVVESANGDIRSAVMALQFASVVDPPSSKSSKGSAKKGKDDVLVLESITRREQSLVLFHLMGKILYSKRRGDPPSASASKKDIEREKEADRRLREPPKLPEWWSEHERRASRVDVDMLYADSPIDSSLLSLYIHQNYTEFCQDVDQCDGIADTLSWVDSSGGEQWYQTNPHAFHLLALGTMHALPSPVPRNGQRVFKPEFFEYRKKERDAEDGVRDVRDWIGPSWTPDTVATDLGGVLKASLTTSSSFGNRAPSTHRVFSHMPFIRKVSGRAEHLDVTEFGLGMDELAEEAVLHAGGSERMTTEGGWLEGDDIEDF